MTRTLAVAEDLRKFGLAVAVSAIVGGLLEDVVPVGVSVLGGIIGTSAWTVGLLLTPKKEGAK